MQQFYWSNPTPYWLHCNLVGRSPWEEKFIFVLSKFVQRKDELVCLQACLHLVLKSKDKTDKGRPHKEKRVFFRALPKLGKPPLPPSNSGNLVTFFRTSNRRFVRMTDKSTFYYNKDCNYNYDSNGGNFDDDDKKHTHIISFE